MLEDWQNKENREKIRCLAIDIQEHANLLLDVPLPIDQREHLLHIHHAAQTLLALTNYTSKDALSKPTTSPTLAGSKSIIPAKTPPCTAEESGYNENENTTGEIGRISDIVLQKFVDTNTEPSRSLNILLVEDNPFTQKLMTRLLKLRNHTVTVANHGEEALALLTSSHTQATASTKQVVAAFDLILMDVRMPIMNGLETTTAIRQWENQIYQQERQNGQAQDGLAQNGLAQENRHLPIIAVTALISEADRGHALQAGMDAFHGKPIQANQLFAEIDRLVPTTAAPPPSEAQDRRTNNNLTIKVKIKESNIKTKLDISSLLKTMENDRELLKEVIDLYRMDAPEQIRCIRDGIEKNAATLVQDAAHALKGASGAFGKTPAYDLAFKLEQIGRSQDLSQAADVLEQLQHAVDSLENALHEELTKHGAQQ